MSRSKMRHFIVAAISCLLIWAPKSVLACSACYGKTDSQLAVGMNWGIFSLLFVVGCVLGGISAFFIYLARRSAATSPAATISETQKA